MVLSDTLKKYRWQGVAVITAAVAVVLVLIALVALGPRADVATDKEVVISEGLGAGEVARLLQEEGVISSAGVFRVYARLTGRSQSLQAGRYLVCPCDSIPKIVDAISSGRALSDDLLLTIPEGMNIWEIDRLLSDEGFAESGFFTKKFLQNEGRYFPDTYRLGENATAADLADKMYATFLERSERYTDEQIIVASMLEKEAKTAEDMALVAGVIYRRLDIGMALQIDATVAYGWCLRTAGDSRVCDVTQAPIATEIGVDGPYNTYARQGLPAGPISNPGRKALQAAANPKSSDYLFYLSTRDGSELIFSETSEEHLRNRREHLGL